VVIANLREAKVLACRSAIVTFLSKRIHRGYRDALPGAMAPILFKSDNVESSDEPVRLGTTSVLSPEVAPAAPASKGPNTVTVQTVTVQGVVIAQPPRSRGSKVLLSRSALFTFLSKRFHYQYGVCPFPGDGTDIIRVRLPGTCRFHQAPSPRSCAKPGVRRGQSQVKFQDPDRDCACSPGRR